MMSMKNELYQHQNEGLILPACRQRWISSISLSVDGEEEAEIGKCEDNTCHGKYSESKAFPATIFFCLGQTLLLMRLLSCPCLWISSWCLSRITCCATFKLQTTTSIVPSLILAGILTPYVCFFPEHSPYRENRRRHTQGHQGCLWQGRELAISFPSSSLAS